MNGESLRQSATGLKIFALMRMLGRAGMHRRGLGPTRSSRKLACAAAVAIFAAGICPGARAQSVPNVVDRRHQIGLQAGGSSVFQVAYRYRFAGPVHLDVGGLGVPHSPINLSLGLLVAAPGPTRFFPYGGLGVGHAGIERVSGTGCYADMAGCDTHGDYLFFAYARAGVGLTLDQGRRHTLGLDLGVWCGTHEARHNDGAGTQTSSSKPLIWPMAGLSYFYAI